MHQISWKDELLRVDRNWLLSSRPGSMSTDDLHTCVISGK
jgi:hypothetical protein